MNRAQLLYKLTGTENPRYLTEREKVMIDKFMGILDNTTPVEAPDNVTSNTQVSINNGPKKLRAFSRGNHKMIYEQREVYRLLYNHATEFDRDVLKVYEFTEEINRLDMNGETLYVGDNVVHKDDKNGKIYCILPNNRNHYGLETIGPVHRLASPYSPDGTWVSEEFKRVGNCYQNPEQFYS